MNIEKICKKIICWGAYLLMFAPLIVSGKFFFPFVGPKSFYFSGLVQIITAAYLVLIVLNSKYRPKLNTLTKVSLIFIVICTLSSIFGADLASSFWSKHERMGGLLTFFHLFSFFIVISSVFKKKEWVKLFEVSIFASLIAGIITLLPQLSGGEIDPLGSKGFDPRGGGTLGNSSFFASYLLFNVFIALWLFLLSFREDKIDEWLSSIGLGKWFKLFTGAGFISLSLILLLMHRGRAALISFFLGIILLFLLRLIFCEKGKLKKAGILLLSAFLIGSLVSIYFVIQEEDNSLKRIVREEFNLSGDNRVAVWRSGIEGWKEKPLLGWGPENYDLVFARHFDSRIFLPEYGANLWYDRAHNIVADTLAMGGILGMLSYLGLFAGAFYVLWKKFLAGQLYFITAGVFTVLLFSYFFQNLTVFDMISSYMMFFMVLGFIGSLESEKEEEVSRQNNPSSLGLITIVSILCIFVASFFTFVIQPMRSSSYMIKAIRTPDLEARISLYEKALVISPLGRYQMRETLERETFILLDQENVERIPVEARKRMLNFVSQELEKNIEESPLLFSSYLKLGRVYNIYAKVVDQSKLDRASEVLEKAVEVSPTYQQAYWYLSQTRLFQGDLEEAIKLAEKAIQLEPRVEKSHLVAVDTARIVGRLTGDYEKALELANKAIEINPEWRENIEFILQQ